MTAFPALGHDLRLGVVHRHDHRHPRHRPAADARGGDDHLCRAQDLGGDGASARAQRGRAVGPAAELRRRAEGLPQGNHHPDQRQQGPVPDRADRHLHRRADRVGGDPVPAGRGARRHQCRPALRPRGELARRLRRDRRRLGVQLQISVLLGAARGGADGELRSVDRLRPDHRRALRRQLQPDRDRARAEGASSSASFNGFGFNPSAVPDVRSCS